MNDESAKEFRPPGNLYRSYSAKGRTYEIWAASLADPAVRKLLDRMQVFVSLFIEAGTSIETDDFEWTLERWTVYFVQVLPGCFVAYVVLEHSSNLVAATKSSSLPRRLHPAIPSSATQRRIDGIFSKTLLQGKKSPMPSSRTLRNSAQNTFLAGYESRSSSYSLPIN